MENMNYAWELYYSIKNNSRFNYNNLAVYETVFQSLLFNSPKFNINNALYIIILLTHWHNYQYYNHTTQILANNNYNTWFTIHLLVFRHFL